MAIHTDDKDNFSARKTMVLFIKTLEHSGIDRYSQELAKRMAVHTIHSRRYLSVKESFRLLQELRKLRKGSLM